MTSVLASRTEVVVRTDSTCGQHLGDLNEPDEAHSFISSFLFLVSSHLPCSSHVKGVVTNFEQRSTTGEN